MSNRYELLKELPYTNAGEIYTQENDNPQYYNYNGGNYRNRIHADYVENNKIWFKKLPERIEVHLFNCDYGHNVFNVKCTENIHPDKFPAIKEAIEEVLNGEGEWHKLTQIASANKWIEMYNQYQDILMQHDKCKYGEIK